MDEDSGFIKCVAFIEKGFFPF